MPWQERSVVDQRLEAIHAVLVCGWSVTQAAGHFSVSRKTLSKWLNRRREDPQCLLTDRSRRPHQSPGRTPGAVEDQILDLRAKTGWGPRKLRAYWVSREQKMPSIRTVASILNRRGVKPVRPREHQSWSRFERATPNELWQIDFKGPLEAGRVPVTPLTILDDHSRYCLKIHPATDRTMKGAWEVLWEVFGQAGLPEALLSDQGFGVHGGWRHPTGISWFDAQLVRLNIASLHGRPRHPQTQGKIEALHATMQRELWPRLRRGSVDECGIDLENWRALYNQERPHEGLGDQVPASRWKPSPRKRPEKLPEVTYAPRTQVRLVSTQGDIRWHRYRLLAGRGLVGELVRVEETQETLDIYYSWKKVRSIPFSQFAYDRML